MIASLAPGALTGAALLLVVGGAFLGVFSVAPESDLSGLLTDRYVLSVLRFTVWQAFLSAGLSVLLAIPVARALARRPEFPGRGLLVKALGLPMVVPTIIGVLGIVTVYGRSGIANDALGAIGIERALDIYGLPGILIAHVFFNMPFAARLLLQGWTAIPGESWRLAAQFGMTGAQIFRLIEAPMLRRLAPGIFGLAFLLCFTSFTVVLVLGGGPPNATLEVAIYQALTFDFDLKRVLAFAVLQIMLCGVLVGLGHRLARPMAIQPTLARLDLRPDRDQRIGRIADIAAIGAGAAFLLIPLLAVFHSAATGPVLRALSYPAVWQAAGRSVAIGLSAGCLSLLLGWGIILTTRDLRTRHHRHGAADAFDLAGSLILVIPPFVIAAGLFVLLRPVADVFALAPYLVVIVNALMGLPFVLRILGPAATDAQERHLRLADSLGMHGWRRFRHVDWPLVRRPAALALALTTALSMGDFGVIALFGSQDTATLPLVLYRQMGAYRIDEAAVTGILLIAITLLLFVAIERGLGGRADD
ncbi:thiamine/thiamine pyrophosphate ABC transporter permease [Inquilinus sp. CAU 1745]|uniref:thiamine/thiamine pyrophosphate ABC transporter permease n=1 Tax=Inquilinus sp. CAU 1745 TaxID=3140369 RepID=UPI00325BA30F